MQPSIENNLTFDADGCLPKASETATKGGYEIGPVTDNTVPSPALTMPFTEPSDYK